MAKVKKEDIKEIATNDLVAKLAEDRLKYKKAKFNHAASPLDNPNVLKAMRRDVARLLTELKKRQQAEQSK